MHDLPALETPWPPGTRLRHYKGGLYEVAGYCLIEATLETGVLYRPLGGDGQPKADLLWMRPLAAFFDRITTPQGDRQRFELNGEGVLSQSLAVAMHSLSSSAGADLEVPERSFKARPADLE